MENTKDWYKSKSFWVNILALIALLSQSFTGFIISIEQQGAILILINLVLRLVTKEEITFGGKTIIQRFGKK